ncbi:DUF6387 family protein [Pandoraea apista]|uniref:DUF6387 family protein n=1 Tax=Pandoraea apista TaxID=93218 RepID=UPI000F625905|nr:DUF6387 family protein [Pandoraea apista]RRJ34363.1 hypothetical protein EIB05_03710 [Pandoraea apista]RRJ81492.1 hypothetical protein EIL82_03815 [Pandoraea apista]RSD08223.1 hypothetical protein EIZ52_24710 [Pandoraea apista]RSD16631.1 hypothetical protein EJB12_05190 [Pandoraea apista]RSK87516.1 hypothetical protein EJE96_02000 [Pandoraea apista]
MAHSGNSVEKSPPGFDITRYAATETFTLDDWATNIYHRVWGTRLRSMMERSIRAIEDTKEEAALRREMVASLRERAITVFAAPLEIYRGELNPTEVDDRDTRLVNDMSVVDYMLIRHAVSQRDSDDESQGSPMASYDSAYWRWKDLKSTESDDDLLHQPYWQLPTHQSWIGQHGHMHLTVELHASEERQVEEFVRWLRATKTALAVPEKRNMFTPADMRKWHRNRVLAYFDIKSWCAVTGVEIDDYRMGLLLFPNDIESANPADKIRKSVRPAANEVFTHTFAEALMDQARLDAKANTGS